MNIDQMIAAKAAFYHAQAQQGSLFALSSAAVLIILAVAAILICRHTYPYASPRLVAATLLPIFCLGLLLSLCGLICCRIDDHLADSRAASDVANYQMVELRNH